MTDSSNTINSLAHTKWNCKYHIVFAPKYRRKVFYEEHRLEVNLILFNNAKIKSIINLATILAKYFLTEKIIKQKHVPELQTAIDFIDANLEKELTISYIEKQTYVSKSSLYSLFHKNFHCTIKEYINKKRIQRACRMLLYTNQSIEHISEFVGFSSGPYFSKVFKNIMKMSPIQYKKTRNNLINSVEQNNHFKN